MVEENVVSGLSGEVRDLLELIVRVTIRQGLIGDILVKFHGRIVIIVVSFWSKCGPGNEELNWAVEWGFKDRTYLFSIRVSIGVSSILIEKCCFY